MILINRSKPLVFFLATIMLTLLSACDSGPSEEENQISVDQFSNSPLAIKMRSRNIVSQAETKITNNNKGSFLAYTHEIRAEVAIDSLETSYEQITSMCQQDTENSCTLLSASLSTQGRINARIQMRIKPAGVELIKSKVESMGELVFSQTSVEDLQMSIVDNEKRLAMLKQYESRLQVLEKDASADINSLIKIANQMSETQANIEFALGQKARLAQRVNMDVLEVRFVSSQDTAFWAPIGHAFADFGANLSRGISAVVTAVAYIIPWMLLGFVCVFLSVKLWRVSRRKKQAN